jgi:hypothetical protein
MTNFSSLSVGGAPVMGNMANPYGRVIYVDGNRGSDGNNGKSGGRAYATMAKAMTVVASGDTIYLRGNVTENITAPAGIFDVSIIGVGNRPRHADAHTGNNGYSGATWKASVTSDPLCIVRQQGWRFENILFACPTTDAALDFIRDAASGDSERDSSHAIVRNCRFAGGQDGIRISGTENVFNVLVEGCMFHDQTGTSIVSSGSYAYRWTIRNNVFVANGIHIDVGFTQSAIYDNTFGKFTTTSIDLTGGTDTMVSGNRLFGTFSISGGYKPGTTCEWGGNFNSLTGGVTDADPA